MEQKMRQNKSNKDKQISITIYGDKGALPTIEHPLPQIIVDTKKPKPTTFTLAYSLYITSDGDKKQIWKSRTKLKKEIQQSLSEKYPNKKIELKFEEMQW
jgi:hypothetical protein